MTEYIFRCEYQKKGCGHAEDCTKQFYVVDFMSCGIRQYHMYLDKFWDEKYGDDAEIVLQQKLEML
jgi:hypothetical protein